MRKIVVIACLLLLLGLLAVGGAYWALNSTGLSGKLARRAILNILPGARVTELAAEQQRFRWPGNFVWENVRFALEYKGRTYKIIFPRLLVSGAESLLRDESVLSISFIKADLVSPPGEAKEAKAELKASLKRRKLVLIEGPVTIASVKWDKLSAQTVTFQLVKNSREIRFGDIRATAYGGVVTGQAKVVIDGLAYSADIQAEGLDTSKLADLSEQFSTQIVGRATGQVRFAGRAQNVTGLEGGWTMLEGTQVNAGLLPVMLPSIFTQYIPNSPERKRLEALIKKGGQLPVELLDFKIRRVTPQSLSAEVKLRSREVNLALNPSYDINMEDGTWMTLLGLWQTFLKWSAQVQGGK